MFSGMARTTQGLETLIRLRAEMEAAEMRLITQAARREAERLGQLY